MCWLLSYTGAEDKGDDMKKKTIRAVYVERTTEVRSSNNSCSGKTIGIACYECVFVALDIQNAKRIHHIVTCGLSGFIALSSTRNSSPLPPKNIYIY